MKLVKIISACRIDSRVHFRLADHDPAETFGLSTEIDMLKSSLADGVGRLAEIQQRLYANGRWAVLIVLQGMDASGKDGAIKHVMSGINPQGCEVHAFKAPSSEELAHNFLWRAGKHLPERGRIGIFNRSHYEEVLVVRIHPEMLERQKLPPAIVGKDIWKRRFKEINAFERHVAWNGTLILKFNLRISKEEQRKRFLARLEEPVKRWKFSMDDVTERRRWDDYMMAYRQSGYFPNSDKPQSSRGSRLRLRNWDNSVASQSEWNTTGVISSPHAANSSSIAFASFRSRVSKPSVNQP